MNDFSNVDTIVARRAFLTRSTRIVYYLERNIHGSCTSRTLHFMRIFTVDSRLLFTNPVTSVNTCILYLYTLKLLSPIFLVDMVQFSFGPGSESESGGEPAESEFVVSPESESESEFVVSPESESEIFLPTPNPCMPV